MPVGENDDFGEISHSKDGYDSGGIYDSRYDTTLTDDERINWGYFRAHIDLFYDMGEYGVIYTDKRSPYHVLKMANCDVTDGESNWKMADFLLENWKRRLAFLLPYFFLSTIRASRVRKPSVLRTPLRLGSKKVRAFATPWRTAPA